MENLIEVVSVGVFMVVVVIYFIRELNKSSIANAKLRSELCRTKEMLFNKTNKDASLIFSKTECKVTLKPVDTYAEE
jgi:hypothetical protein